MPTAYARPLIILILLCAAACRPAPQAVELLPTRAALPGQQLPLEGAERVARAFLESWHLNDFDAMYGLITFTSQEAITREAFTALYQQSHEEMTLENLTYRGNTLTRQSDIAIFNYDVTFHTLLLGAFGDPGRDLRLVPDTRAGDWRVAWTPGEIFAAMAEGGRLRLQRIIPSRANIYDRTGQIALADMNGRVAVVNVIRDDIPDYPNCLNALSAALAQPVAEVQQRLEERPPDWLMEMGTLEPQVYLDTHTVLERYCAATFDERAVRRYPTGAVTANLIGYVGYPDAPEVDAVEAAGFQRDSILGRSGIEKSWDETLRGQPGGVLTVVNQAGEVQREITRARSAPPQSLWLTIDIDLQTKVTEIMADAYAEAAGSWAPTSAGAAAVVIDVNTGEILAMVSYPSFDNDAFTPFPQMGRAAADQMVAEVQADTRKPQLNRPTLGVYQSGSTMKTISALAVADSGVYALDERYTCIGVWNRDIARVDWLAGGHGTVTLPQALTRSCNPYFYEVGYQLDSADPWLFPRYARQFGMGAPTGLRDLPEAAGLIADPDWLRTTYGIEWTFSETVNMSIGQGYLQVTPLQMVRFLAAVANGGTLYRPQLVRQVGILGETPSYILEPDAVGDLGVRQDVLEMERLGLCDVTTTSQGTAEYIFRRSPLQALGVCGKTGTAQAPGNVPSHAWFIAYAPRENPQVATVVMVETSGEGSAIAAPLTRQILEYYFFGEITTP